MEGVRGNLCFLLNHFWQTQSRPSEFSANLNQVAVDVTSLLCWSKDRARRTVAASSTTVNSHGQVFKVSYPQAVDVVLFLCCIARPFPLRAVSRGSLGLSEVAFCNGFVGGGLLSLPWGPLLFLIYLISCSGSVNHPRSNIIATTQ